MNSNIQCLQKNKNKCIQHHVYISLNLNYILSTYHGHMSNKYITHLYLLIREFVPMK